MSSPLNEPKPVDLTQLQTSAADSKLIEVIDERYEVLALLGKGGMGSVYKVRDRQLDKIFALKLLRPELVPDKWVMKRFETEIQAESTLDHPNLVTIYGHGRSADGVPYFVMDYAQGESLAAILKRDGHLEPAAALDIFIQILDGLMHAHQKGLIHRDLKPGNVIIAKTESGGNIVKIVDFGIVKIVSEQKDQRLTQADEIFGSPQYMSPEQCQGEKLDARSDFYSMGCLMYEAIAGSAPFSSEKPVQVLVQHLQEQPPPIKSACAGREIDSRLAAVIMRCLEKNPKDRYQTARQLRLDLLLLQNGQTPPVDLYTLSRKLTKGAVLGNFIQGCLLIAAIVTCGFGIVYRHDISWFVQYQHAIGFFNDRGNEKQYLDLLKISDSETAANVYFKLGQWYQRQSDKEFLIKSNQAFEKAVALLKQTGKNPGLLVQCLQSLAENAHAEQNLEQARKYAEAAVKESKHMNPNGEAEDIRFAGNWYYSTDFCPADLSITLSNIAQAYWQAEQNAKAEAVYREAIDVAQTWQRQQQPSLDLLGLASSRRIQLVNALLEYSEFCHNTGNQAESRRLSQRALVEMDKPPYSKWPSAYKPDDLERVGNLSLSRGDPPQEAEKLFRQSLALRIEDEGGLGYSGFAVAQCRAYLGDTLAAQKRYSEAEAEFKEALAVEKKEPFAADHSDICERLAKLYWQENRRQEAFQILREGLASNNNAERILKGQKPNYDNWAVPDEAGYQQLADYLRLDGQFAQAAKAYSDVVTISKINGSDYAHQGEVLEQYAASLAHLNQNKKAQELLIEARQLAARKGGPSEPALIMQSSANQVRE